MKLNIALSYTALLMEIAMLLVFFPKIKVKSIRTKLFTIAMICATCFALSDVTCVLSHQFTNIDFLNKFTWMFRWMMCCLAVYFYALYVLCVAYAINVKKIIDVIKHNLLTKLYTLLLICVPIVYAIFFFNQDFDINNINYVSKSSLYLIIPFAFFLGLTYIIEIFRHKENSLRDERFGVVFQIFIMILGILFQVIFPYYSTIPMTMVLTSYCSYFFGDNPDILLIRDIKNAKNVIDESNKVKVTFLSNMSDGIKVQSDKIVNLGNELEVLQLTEQEKRKNILNDIKSCSYSLLDTVNNVLDSCVVEGNSSLQIKSYKTKDLLNDIITSSKMKFGSKNVKFICNIDENIPESLIGDYSKIKQSILNLLINSIENTEVGRITFTVSSNKSGEFEELLFKVTDTGRGMKDEVKNNLFNRNLGSSGLGAIISKKYVEMMNGKIWFESDYEVGTTFYVQISQKIENAKSIGKLMIEDTQNKEYLDCSEKTVLLVDDDKLNSNLTKRFLQRYKFNVEIVESGLDCLNNIKLEKKYDLIITDYLMPNMNGKELLDALKGLGGYTIPPVVVLTANAITGMKEKFIKEGFSDYLAKPINVNELDRIVNTLFKN